MNNEAIYAKYEDILNKQKEALGEALSLMLTYEVLDGTDRDSYLRAKNDLEQLSELYRRRLRLMQQEMNMEKGV